MKRLAFVALLVASAALAHSGFRTRLREVEGRYRVQLRDDGQTPFEVTCNAGNQQLLDGGTWPLKVTSAEAAGANPIQAIRDCVRQLERANGLDGGAQ